MKKIMIFAVMMLVASTTVFAASSDALKAILKSKTYDEAASLVKSTLDQLASPAEKAEAYNKLVDLAMEKVNNESTIITSNQMVEQFGKGELEPYDTLGLYTAVYNAIENGIECDKYDVMPNEKGKVKPAFHSKNQSRLWVVRTNLINAGQYAANQDDNAAALNNYGLYVETANSPLFSDVDKTTSPDLYIGEVARVAAVYAYQDKNIDLANKYVDVALQDTAKATHTEALNLKLYIAQQQLNTKEDSLQYIQTLKDFYVKDKTNDQIFGQLADFYGKMQQTDAFKALITEKIAEDPNNYTAWALKGQDEMNAKKWDDAVASFKKAIAIKADEPIVYTFISFCFNSKASEINNNPDAVKSLYQESLPYVEKAKELDPNREKANWAYPLYQCYYALYGDADPRTQEASVLIK